MNYNDRFKQMLKDLGLTKKDVSRITGNTYDSVRTTTQPSKSFPRNLRLAIWVHEQHLKNKTL